MTKEKLYRVSVKNVCTTFGYQMVNATSKKEAKRKINEGETDYDVKWEYQNSYDSTEFFVLDAEVA
jgi:hypothetical protein